MCAQRALVLHHGTILPFGPLLNEALDLLALSDHERLNRSAGLPVERKVMLVFISSRRYGLGFIFMLIALF